MNRRQLIQSLSLLLGSSLSPSLLASMAGHAHAHHQPREHSAAKKTYRYQLLAIADVKLLSTLGDTIIPRTETPGASDVGVPPFIDLMLAEWYDDSDSRRYIKGLRDFSLKMRTKHTRHFNDLAAAVRDVEINALDRKVMVEKSAMDDVSHFYRMTKALTLIGYYTSAEGMEQELKYKGLIGEYDFSPSGPPDSVTRY